MEAILDFDPAQFRVLLELQDSGDAAFLKELIRDSERDIAEEVTRMTSLSVDGDLDKIAHLANSLKGSSSTFGLMRMNHWAKAIETAAKAKDRAKVQQASEALTQAFLAGYPLLLKEAEASIV